MVSISQNGFQVFWLKSLKIDWDNFQWYFWWLKNGEEELKNVWKHSLGMNPFVILYNTTNGFNLSEWFSSFLIKVTENRLR